MKKLQMIDIVKKMVAAPSCCEELKEAGEHYLHSVGSDEESAAATALIERAKEDITPIDGLIALAQSDHGKEIFGDAAPQVAADAEKAKEDGAVYCTCDACQCAAKLIKHAEIIL